MIKTATKDKPVPSVKPFPKLMKSGDVIVLFSQKDYGVAIVAPHNQSLIGVCNIWTISRFEDYNGMVTLENE